MADITDPELIRYCNDVIRPISELMVNLYYECDFLYSAAVADNDINETIQNRGRDIRNTSDQMRDWIVNSAPRDNVWFNVGTPSPYNQQFPNDSSRIIDGSPDDGRPSITGADVHEMMSQTIAFQNWMNDASFGGNGTGTNYEAMMNTIITVGGDGNNPLRDSQVSLFINNRCNEIRTEYQANGNAKIIACLRVAPNPREPRSVS